MDKKAKYTLNKIGVFYSVFGAVTVAMQTVIAFYLVKYHRSFVVENRILISVLLSMVITDIFGVWLIYLLTMNMPKWENPRKKLSALEFLKYYSICPTIVLIFGMLGTAIQKSLFGKTGNAAGDVVGSGSNKLVVIVAVGIFAPIFEELIFRKILIDHLAHKGKLLAILVSGISFGLYHGNFSQFFFAAALGLLFAFVYVKTGNIWYTIIYHFLNNMPNVLSSYGGNQVAMAYGSYMIIMALVGFIVFVLTANSFRLHEVEERGKIVGGKAVTAIFTSYGMILFFIVCGVIFFKTYS